MKNIIRTLILLALSWPAAAQYISVEDAVDVALEKNFDIQVQRATSELAFNDKRYAIGAFLPVISATGSYLKSSQGSRTVSFADAVTEHTGVQQVSSAASIQLLWPIFDGSRMFATRRRILELAELGEVQIRNQMMNSVAAVITNYYGIVRQKQQLLALQELLAVNEERIRLAEKRFQVGTGAKPELLQAKVDYNANRVLSIQQETLIQQLKDQLNGLAGMGLPAHFEISDSIPINLDLTEEEILAGLETNNQQLLAQKRNIDVANAALWAAKALRSPVINVSSSYSYNLGQTSVQTSPFALQYNRSNVFTYGLTASLPIVNNLSANRQISAAKIDLGRQQTMYDQIKTTVVVLAKNAFTAYENARKMLVLEEQSILIAKENVAIALETFRRGNITFIELRTAQQTLAETYAGLILARYNCKAAETELLRLKGDLLK